VWESAPGWTLVSISLVFAQGLLPLVLLYLLKLLVNAVSTGLAAPDKATAARHIAALVALSGGATILTALCATLAKFAVEAQSLAVTDHMMEVLHRKSIEVDLEYYENPQYYDTLHLAQMQAPFRPTMILTSLLQASQNAVSLVGIAGLLLSLRGVAAGILFAAGLPAILVKLRYSQTLYRWSRSRTSAERQADYYSGVLTQDDHAKELRLYELGALFMRRYHDVRAQLRKERLAIVGKRSAAEIAAESTTISAVCGLYLLIAYRTIHGLLTLGDLVMYYQAIQRAQAFLSQTFHHLAEFYQSNIFLSDFYEFLDLKPKVTRPIRPMPVRHDLRTGITFEHVRFHYPNSDRKVLEDVTLSIRPGEHVAFVGENGTGKTTLIKLLCRLYDPTGGCIRLDGVDIREFDPAALRREISAVFQDYVQYYLSAGENIWLGDITSSPEQARIVAAGRSAGIHDKIATLKDGYESVLGNWFADGEQLSIGQWQKIALARAFMRSAGIIILDEPTSAIDPRAEYELFKRFDQLTHGRTAILISHRFSTVRMADRIYVLEDGRIAECGSHDDLIDRGGRYAHLFETQAQYYR
jgi:ATP-binding cassette subfamily B protein